MGSRVILEHTDKLKCKDSLRNWSSNGESKYWHPRYWQFSHIDCVTKCQRITLDAQGREKTQDLLAYIQVTIARKHSLNVVFLMDVDKIFKPNYQERVYVAVLPERGALA